MQHSRKLTSSPMYPPPPALQRTVHHRAGPKVQVTKQNYAYHMIQYTYVILAPSLPPLPLPSFFLYFQVPLLLQRRTADTRALAPLQGRQLHKTAARGARVRAVAPRGTGWWEEGWLGLGFNHCSVFRATALCSTFLLKYFWTCTYHIPY